MRMRLWICCVVWLAAESGDSDDSESRAAAAAARREPLPALEDTGDGWEADGPDEVERVLGHRWVRWVPVSSNGVCGGQSGCRPAIGMRVQTETRSCAGSYHLHVHLVACANQPWAVLPHRGMCASDTTVTRCWSSLHDHSLACVACTCMVSCQGGCSCWPCHSWCC
jgi:hypothetical protein